MPACVTHYQFGQDVLDRLDPKLKQSALMFKQEFDVGLQGPDIFFFYKPYRKNEISGYGSTRHDEPAIRMFAPILANVHDKAALAYLMGLFCHYTLDRCCHPYIDESSNRNSIDHGLIESAFDRHILSYHGLSEKRYRFLPTKGLDYEAMSALWPGMTAKTIEKCVKAQHRYIRLLGHRWLLNLAERIVGARRGTFTSLALPDTVSDKQTENILNLHALYTKALDECLEMIRRIPELMGKELMRGQGFDKNYEGKQADEQTGEKLDPL